MINQRGFITFDFLFSLVIIFGFTGILFTLTLTLTAVEMVQYATFASARNYFASHLAPPLQKQQAVLKYQQIMNHPTYIPLFRGTWFLVPQEPFVGQGSEIFPEFQDAGSEGRFLGVGAEFLAPILSFNIPLLGPTDTDDEKGAGFKTFIGSYLGREVSFNECINFVTQRWEAISRLAPPGASAPYSTAPAKDYATQADNGC